MNWVDFTALAIVALPALSGLRHGLLAGLLKFGSILLALGIALWQMPPLVGLAAAHTPLPAATAPVAILLTALILGWLVGALLALAWKKLSEGTVAWTDRALGCLSGAVKGSVLAALAMITLSAAWPQGKSAVEASWVSRNALGPLVEAGREQLARRLGMSGQKAP